RDTIFALTADDERRRFEFAEFAGVAGRRPLVVALWIRPRRALHVVLFEPQFIGRVHGDFVVDARVADDGLEAPVVRGDPVGHVAAIRAAGGGHACAVDEGIFLQRVI